MKTSSTVTIKRAGESKAMPKLRPGRLSNVERLKILNVLGKKAQKRYNELLSTNTYGYNLENLRDSLQFQPNVEIFENDYWVDAGSEELNRIADYFENGTGLFNTQYKHSDRSAIVPLRAKVLKFRKIWKGRRFASSVRGVRAIHMFLRTVKSMEFNREYNQRQARYALGI